MRSCCGLGDWQSVVKGPCPCAWSREGREPGLARATHRLVCFQTLQYLQQNAKERAELAASAAGGAAGFCAPAAASRLSAQELEELRKQLGSVAAGSTPQQVRSPRRPCGGQSWTTGLDDSAGRF